jgi:16S rRNA (guanine(966)-N(2))-methyltransferase RsmD
MRIVGGQWRGRRLLAPKGIDTRPTSDRAREGLFGALEARLGPAISSVRVLDLFAGTGALGLEALSRGGARAVFVEDDPSALAVLAANVSALSAQGASDVVRGDAFSGGGRRAGALGPFALLLLDPPYRIDAVRVWETVLSLDRDGALADDVLIAYEHRKGSDVSAPRGFASVRTYVYGDTAVTLVERDLSEMWGDAPA